MRTARSGTSEGDGCSRRARAAGWGGLAAVADITRLARSTIERGLKDLDEPSLAPGQVRREGGGRHQSRLPMEWIHHYELAAPYLDMAREMRLEPHRYCAGGMRNRPTFPVAPVKSSI